MATYNTNVFKSGLRIILDQDPYIIVENEFVKPGKGQAFNRVRVRNLKTGKVIDKTFKSGESAEAADVNHAEMEFLYHDNDSWHFMNTVTFDQIEINSSQMGNAKKWLVGQEVCEIVLWNGQPISVNPPVIVELRIISSEPGVKGDTVSGATKNATLETNVEIQVPLFVNENEVIRVDTRNMSYVGRAKT